MRLKYVLAFLLVGTTFVSAQVFQGPAKGSVQSGVVVTTDNFTIDSPAFDDGPEPPKNKIPFSYPPEPNGLYVEQPVRQTEVQNDPSFAMMKKAAFDSSITISSFNGITDAGTNIPPDPYLAVGPDHILTTVNTTFRISTKSGLTVKTFNANTWYASVHPEIKKDGGVGAFDPKVIFDHYDKRWVMVWLDYNESKKTAYFLISVSDDADPTGTWYNYRLPSNYNGSVDAQNWADYQGVGYDSIGVYITSNQWSYGGSFQYPKIRCLDKKQLYANTAGPLEWTDFWSIREKNNGEMVFGIRPARVYGNTGEYYFLSRSPFTPSRYMVLHKLSNPFGAAQLTAVQIPVTSYSDGSNAGQLGGGTPGIEAGGSQLRNEPLYRNGILHAVFAVKNSSFSSLRYVAFDVAKNTIAMDKTFNADGYWHYYPALAVDVDNNVVITYSRSSATEYAGAYYISKPSYSTDFSGSKPIARGQGNYVKTFDSDRNRWGDYNGAWVDPKDGNNIWLYTEYAAGTNTWGAWIAGVRLMPYKTPFAFVSASALDFPLQEVGTSSEVKSIVIKNYGYQGLEISNITHSDNSIKVLNMPSVPVKIALYDSLVVNVQFVPEKDANITDALAFSTNDPAKPQIAVDITAKGFEVRAAAENTFYAAAGTLSKGELFSVDPATGASKSIGSTGYPELQSLMVHPATQEVRGLYIGGTFTSIVRANAATGTAYTGFSVNLKLKAAAYTETALYGITENSRLYRLEEKTSDTVFVSTVKIPVTAMAYNPVTKEMWVSAGSSFAGGRDKLYKIDISTGDTVYAGKTGLNLTVNSLAFDKNGNLYGTTGNSIQISNLISIDKLTGAGTVIGPVGYKGVKGLAVISMPKQTDVADNNSPVMPKDYSLSQNYPNPFNPSTVIAYSIPAASHVSLKVYDAIGHQVAVLVNEDRPAGTYSVRFSAGGKNLPSGVYFYTLTAGKYTQTKKMLLIK